VFCSIYRKRQGVKDCSDEVSRNGYAIANQEIIPGGVCVGVPIFDKSNKIIASISASVPVMRATSEQMLAILPCDSVIIKTNNFWLIEK